MNRIALLLAAAGLAASSGPVLAGAASFNLINGTSGGLSEVSIRRAGTNEWKPIGAAPAPGAIGQVQFSDPDCAFDIRANVAGAGPTTWTGINLCGARSVKLNRDAAAGAWVDYDQ
jgi:hypothetical protein